MSVVADALSHVSTALGAGAGNETGSVDQGKSESGRFKVTAANVTGSVVVTIQTSPDNSTWVTVGSATAGLTSGQSAFVFGVISRYVRVSWNVTTGPADVTVTADLI
jgi:hypothetical protein